MTEERTEKTRRDTNWFDELSDDEVKQGKNGQVYVPLHSLRKLAEKAGLVGGRIQQYSVIPLDSRNRQGIAYIAGVIYVAKFNDGTEWTGVADAHPYNCSSEVATYLSAVAESRAEGRALRKALGIDCLTEEEVSEDASVNRMTNEVDPSQKKLIEKLMKTKGITLKEIFASCSKRNVLTLDELTYDEARVACKFVNDYKKPKEKK